MLGATPGFSSFFVNAQSSNCPSNPLRVTNFGGVPAGFNMLTSPPSQPDFFAIRLMYLGISPYVFTNGTTDYSNSLTDWVSSNANYTQWTFNIKPGMTWSNGQNVTSQDILNTYSPQFAFNSTLDFLNLHTEVSKEYALNSSAAVFVLNQSDAHFPEKAGQNVYTAVYPKSFISQGNSYSGLNGTDVGDGPFYVSNYTAGQTQMIMLRNPYFKPLPAVCEIIINFVESTSQVPTYLIAGTTDWGGIGQQSAAAVLKNPTIHILDTPAIDNLFMMYNITLAPYNQLAFRQALAYAINETQIQSQAYAGYDTVAYAAKGGIPPETKLWYNPSQHAYSYNTTTALALLNTLGIKKGSDGFLQFPNGTDITLNIYNDNEFTECTIASGIVQQNLQNIGFKVNLNSIPIGNIIGDTYTNTNNINHAMIILQSGAPVFGLPYLDALTEWQVYEPTAPYPVWLSPPSVESDYTGNVSKVLATGNSSEIYTALANIQSLNAQYLPNIILGFPDALFAYNTQRWVNWPSFMTYGLYTAFNVLSFAEIQPAGTQTSSTSVSQIPTTTQTNISASSSSSLSTVSSTSSSSSNLIVYAGIVVVIVVIIGIAAAVMMRRRPPKNSPSAATPQT